MLEDSLFESVRRKKTRKPMTVVVSAAVHVVTIGILVLVPLLQTQALTIPPVDMSLLLPHIATPKPVQVFSARPRVRTTVEVDPGSLITPQSIPTEIAVVVDEPPKPEAGLGFGASVRGDNNIASLFVGAANPPSVDPVPPTPPPPPPPPPVIKAQPVRVSHLEQADLIYRVNPVYPPLAKQTRVQGVVVLEATISKEGAIESLRVVSGHPLLTKAALDAVQQWRYRPVLLNGEPIDIITTITVSFTLQ